MKRKRLNHFGDAIIGILTGYQVISNFDYLKKHGQGKYILDLLTCKFTFNGRDVELFPLFSNIQKWFNKEITKNKIDIKLLAAAEIIFEVGPISVQQVNIETRSWLFFKKVLKNDIYNCKTAINLILKTDEMDYSKKKEAAINY